MNSGKVIHILVGLVLTGTAMAGTMGPTCDASNVQTTCTVQPWVFEGSALYIQPAYSAVAWAKERTVTASDTNVTQSYGTLPDYGWGFFLRGAYQFEQGKDASFNVYYFDSSTTSADRLANSGTGGRTITSKWVAANFELSQSLNINRTSDLRFFGGVQYARIATENSFSKIVMTADAFGGLPEAGQRFGTNEGSFNGFGPRIGTHFSYSLPDETWFDGWGVYLNGAVGLLAGVNHFRSWVAGGASTSTTGSFSMMSNQVVPEIDLKLGLDYTRTALKGDLTFDAGWMWVDYISVIAAGRSIGNGNVSFQGLYFGMKWSGSVA
ncbi:MAG: Lpg1974 family pore-forming outer membrane protein [Legionellaceae bacterium]|nr:Lpg1974 family pore-forming outer membrane protein [Legionellaceae bacterium]